MNHPEEILHGARFAFGKNWANFLKTLSEDRIKEAEKSLQDMLEIQTLDNLSFLDVGSGSGLFSLAARRLGAYVHSFDYDPESVACTAELKRRYFPNDNNWTIEEGDVLNKAFLESLGQFDMVYSWGVLHHTGAMWQALENVVPLIRSGGGRLFIAIYNHMGGASKRWKWIKKTYCELPSWLKLPFALAIIGPIQLRSLLIYAIQGKAIQYFNEKLYYQKKRGMSWWHDQIDWIGGYPYEDARPEEVFRFMKQHGLMLENFTTCGGGIGCNQFVFSKL